MLTARTKTIERTGTGRQFPPSLALLSATKFSLEIYMELTGANLRLNLFVLLCEFLHARPFLPERQKRKLLLTETRFLKFINMLLENSTRD